MNSIDSILLARICKVLDYNFFKDMATNYQLSGINNPDAIRELNNREAIAQFSTVVPKILEKHGLEPVICFGRPLEFPEEFEYPDYSLANYNVTFTLNNLLCDRFEPQTNMITIQRFSKEEVGVDVEVWHSCFNDSLLINILLDYKSEEEWERVILNIFSNFPIEVLPH